MKIYHSSPAITIITIATIYHTILLIPSPSPSPLFTTSPTTYTEASSVVVLAAKATELVEGTDVVIHYQEVVQATNTLFSSQFPCSMIIIITTTTTTTMSTTRQGKLLFSHSPCLMTRTTTVTITTSMYHNQFDSIRYIRHPQ